LKSVNDFGGFASIDEYLETLWWTMHHSDDPDRQVWTFDVRCYLDESGTHDASPYTVVAGLMLNRNNFISLGREWQQMLCERGIKVPIHMKQFGRDGNLGYLTESDRYLLFANIAGIINSHKIYSVAGVIDQKQYNEILILHKKKEMSPYGFCLMLLVYANHVEAINNKYKHDIAYLLSEVSEHKGQILDSHAEMIRLQEEESIPFHVGTIAFGLPRKVPALQAADVISWGVLRRFVARPFDQGFEFIEHIINGDHHVQHLWEEKELQTLAHRFMEIKESNY
jgi:hypothetical protein